MVVRTAVLILLLMLSGTAGAAPSRNRCLSCHPVHYADQGSCLFCHRGNQTTSRKELAHSGIINGRYATFTNPQAAAVIAGKKLADQFACRRCHQLLGSGNRLAAQLDRLLWTTRPQAIRAALVDPALYMPAFHFTDADLDRLVTVILAGGLKHRREDREPPQVVHFSSRGSDSRNVFVKQCGACHKLLSHRDGGLGDGTVGPNLSGLLSRYYPATFEDGKPWSGEHLRRWLKNPRSVRKETLMRPVLLKPDEFEQLLKIFELPQEPSQAATLQ